MRADGGGDRDDARAESLRKSGPCTDDESQLGIPALPDAE